MNAHTDPNDAHAVYAPSSAHRWMPCTASAEAIARLPEQEEGEEAAEGTAAHDEIERVLGPLCQTKQTQDPAPYPQSEPIDPEHDAAYGVALVVDYVRKLPPGKLWIEQRVRLTPQIWGRCDVAHFHEPSGVLTIVDYKNGYVPVDAEENEQLRIYAAGSAYTHNLPVRWIRYAVVQPNDFRPVPRVKQWGESPESLYAFASKAAAVPFGPKTFTAGEHCRYCPLFGRCPPTQDLLRQFSHVAVNPAHLVPTHQIALFEALEKPIADWFKGLRKHGTKLAEGGTKIPGMKLGASNAHRIWKNPAVARAAIVAQFGVDKLDPPTPAQAEDMGLDKAWIKENVDRPPGKPTLMRESDWRDEYVPKSVQDMFGASIAAINKGTP